MPCAVNKCRFPNPTVGAKREVVDALPVISYHTNKNNSDTDSSATGEDENCLICLENFAEQDSVKLLPCFHRFHDSCVNNWLERSASCPICKFSI
jgi:hypothetical protein